MAKLFDRVKMSVSGTPGTGNITLGSAVSGFRTFATAGVSNSDIVSYVAEDGTAWEIGTATYSTTGPALNSRTVTSNSAGDTNPISLTSSAVVFSAAVRADLVNLREANTFASTGSIRLPNTGLKIEDTGNDHVLTVATGGNLTADRTLTLTTNDADRTLTLTASSSIGGTAYVAGGTDVAVADGGTGLSSYAAGDLVYASGTTTLAGLTVGAAGTILVGGAAPSYSANPQVTTIELGHATDTTLSRSSAGVLAVEGVTVSMNSVSATHTAVGIELGHATDTTITRSAAGVIAVEGVTVPLNSITNTHTAQQIELGHATDTTITRSSAGVIAVEGVSVPLNSITNTHTAQQIELGHATDTTLTRSAAGVVAVEGTVLKKAGKETIWVPASAMIARTTNGAASGTTESTTNKVMSKTLDFDTTTAEHAQFTVTFPKSWDEGTVTFIPYWTAASGSGTVIFTLAGLALSNDDAVDTAFGTAQSSTDTLITALDVHVGPESSAITIAGTPAEGDLVWFQVARDISDTLGVDAKLLGVKLIFTTNAANDD